jgi:hypothetical protein
MYIDDIRHNQVELGRAMREGRDAEAERLAVELAPYFDVIAEAEDKNPKAIVPQWGLLA